MRTCVDFLRDLMMMRLRGCCSSSNFNIMEPHSSFLKGTCNTRLAMKQSRPRTFSMLSFMTFLATVGILPADSLLVAPASRLITHSVLASRNTHALYVTPNEEECGVDEECGEGFYKQTGPDGDYCVFDYDSASRAFGTAEHVEDPETYWKALEDQNNARQKFGMEPLTPEEYVALQAQIHQMDIQLIADATAEVFADFDSNRDGVITVKELKEGLEKVLRIQLSEDQVQKIMIHFDSSGDGLLQLDEFVTIDKLRTQVNNVVTQEQEEEEQTRPSILQHFMNNMFQNTCESNYDCEKPEVCCDFHFKKMCCSSGEMAREIQWEYATVPVPQGFT